MRGVGRDRKKEALWRRRIREQAGSGLSIRQWCHRNHQPENSFYWWRAQLIRRDAEVRSTGPARKRQPKFVPVHVQAGPAATDVSSLSLTNGSPPHIGIVLPQERYVRVIGPVDRQALSDVLAVLSSLSAADAEAATC